MCGRYSITTAPEALRALFEFEESPNLRPRYNLAPTQDAPVVVEADGQRHLRSLRWGLVPAWAKDTSGGARMINARSETVAEKPSFRDAYKKRRCLVPADGFYEWRTEAGKKQPYRVTTKADAPFAFAGLWERWRPKGPSPSVEEEIVETFTILTTDAAPSIHHIHHRMPVMLRPDQWHTWLDVEAEEASSVLAPFDDKGLIAFPVSTRVGSVKNDDPSLLEPQEPLVTQEAPEPPKPKQGSLF